MTVYLKKSTYILLFILSTALGTKTFARGDFGTYFIQGTAYGKDKLPLQNVELMIIIGDSTTTIKTNSLGQFVIEVKWETACATNDSKKTLKQLNEQLNPENIIVNYTGKEILIKNEWEKYSKIFPVPKEKIILTKDLNFN